MHEPQSHRLPKLVHDASMWEESKVCAKKIRVGIGQIPMLCPETRGGPNDDCAFPIGCACGVPTQ